MMRMRSAYLGGRLVLVAPPGRLFRLRDRLAFDFKHSRFPLAASSVVAMVTLRWGGHHSLGGRFQLPARSPFVRPPRHGGWLRVVTGLGTRVGRVG